MLREEGEKVYVFYHTKSYKSNEILNDVCSLRICFYTLKKYKKRENINCLNGIVHVKQKRESVEKPTRPIMLA